MKIYCGRSDRSLRLCRVTNNGPNQARHATLAVTIGNYPSLQALPSAEFRYPQDWYPGDWNTLALQNNHLYLGESPSRTFERLDQIAWTSRVASRAIPDPHSWHPCILAEVRARNNDSAGGTFGCDIQADPGTCNYGAYFWATIMSASAT